MSFIIIAAVLVVAIVAAIVLPLVLKDGGIKGDGRPNGDTDYSVTVHIVGNMPMKDIDVYIYDTDVLKDMIDYCKADDKGVATFKLEIDTVACADGWTYKLSNGFNEFHYSTAWEEDEYNVAYINLSAGDTVTLGVSIPGYVEDEYFAGYYAYVPASGSVTFNTTLGFDSDVDCDGKITSADLVRLAKSLAE